PFCGSGTIPIEAALIGQNIAPGFNRDFASSDWDFIGSQVWEKALDEAEQMANYDQPLNIVGSDIDHKMIEVSKQNALEAGLSDLIDFKQMQVADLSIREDSGYLVGNPPYGERLKDSDYVKFLYKTLGEVMSKHPTWSVYIMTSFKEFESLYGRKASKRRKLFNGFIETQYYQFFGRK
ncbi:MAG TPA: class I SAM-dependent RNA methyltransferase, partial [Pseudogracilibacillus sp.]|nr:class I SAM-dependent RNA methyltransferase [Pseudogracilibacillus sp.]